ncbi:MAG: uroporphyrin-III C-methyltransferase [Actinomycetota bacterium]|nr:uroporphyrin-III C-methyltransferase [Actinomycetota bacterium]
MTVFLVGGGPGDPGLLTLRAESLLRGAATVVADGSVTHLAAEFAPEAELVRVSDRTAAVGTLLDAAVHGPGPVVRLYAGDTWLHPGHAAEAAALAEAGVEVEAVAGVAIEVAVPAAAGIAVHVRHLAVACTFADASTAPPPVDATRTIVVVTDDVAATARAMAAAGDPSLPAAGLVSGRPPVRGLLADLAAAEAGLVVVGSVTA